MTMSLFNRLFINATAIYTERVFEAILQFALLAFILFKVGKEYYASALLIISIQQTIELARGGIQKSTLKYISEYNAKEDYSTANKILSSSSAMQGAIGILGFLICFSISSYITDIFSLPEYMRQEAQIATIILGVGIAVAFAISPWQNSLKALERYDLVSVTTFSGKCLRAILIVILILANNSALISIVIGTLAGVILERLLCLFFVKKISPLLKFKFKNITTDNIKIILHFSFFDFFNTFANLLYFQGSLLLATHLISLSAVAALGIIANINQLIVMSMSQIAQMFVPVASRLKALQEDERLRNVIISGTRLIVFSGGIILAGLLPWLESFLTAWLGNSYAELSSTAIILITASYLMNSITCIHNSLGGVGKVSVDGISNTICTLIGLSIGVIILHTTRLELTGFAVGLLIARLLRFSFIIWYGTSVFHISCGKLLRTGFLRTYALLTLVFLIGWSTGITVNSWKLFVPLAGATISLYIFIGYYWVLDIEDRYRLISFLKITKYK